MAASRRPPSSLRGLWDPPGPAWPPRCLAAKWNTPRSPVPTANTLTFRRKLHQLMKALRFKDACVSWDLAYSNARTGLARPLTRPLLWPPCSFWLAPLWLSPVASCWPVTSREWTPVGPFPSWSLVSWCSCLAFTTCWAPTELTKATRAAHTVTFQTVVDSPYPGWRSVRRFSEQSLKVFNRSCRNTQELRNSAANLEICSKTMIKFYKFIHKMLFEFTIS